MLYMLIQSTTPLSQTSFLVLYDAIRQTVLEALLCSLVFCRHWDWPNPTLKEFIILGEKSQKITLQL